VKAKGTKRKEKGNIVVKRQNKRLGTYKRGYKGAREASIDASYEGENILEGRGDMFFGQICKPLSRYLNTNAVFCQGLPLF
jgi:hypothetical protein